MQNKWQAAADGFKGGTFLSCLSHIALSLDDPVNSQNIDDIVTKEGKQYVRFCIYRYIVINMKMGRKH
jgi:hypothetical protein